MLSNGGENRMKRTHHGNAEATSFDSGCMVMRNSARGDFSTASELKAVEGACREASRTVEPCELGVSAVKYFS
jgi:hypothetical protein